MRKTAECSQCKHHDPEWREYSQLITCKHPRILEANGRPIWSLYPLEGFCGRYGAFEQIQDSR